MIIDNRPNLWENYAIQVGAQMVNSSYIEKITWKYTTMSYKTSTDAYNYFWLGVHVLKIHVMYKMYRFRETGSLEDLRRTAAFVTESGLTIWWRQSRVSSKLEKLMFQFRSLILYKQSRRSVAARSCACQY